MTQTKNILDIFKDDNIIIKKDIYRHNNYSKKIPKYVIDYLVSNFVDTDNPKDGIEKIDSLLSNYHFKPDKKELVKSNIRQNGTFCVIDKIKITYDQTKDMYWADIPSVDSNTRIILPIIEKYGKHILTKGLWGRVEIAFDPRCKIGQKIYPFIVTDFYPLQITNPDISHFIEKRKYFSKKEWIDLLISTMGFNPNNLTDRQKILYLCRLVCLAENSTHMVELGPTETGKTYTFKNLSSNSYVVSGSNITVAGLFYNKLTKRLGIVGTKDVVVFDEITTSHIKIQSDVVNILKDMMNSGTFSRGNDEFSTDCSMYFIGNIEKNNYNRHLFCGFPSNICDDYAFIDRINGFIPGWELPKISSNNYANGYGFINDYFSCTLDTLRDLDYSYIINEFVTFNNINNRNRSSIIKISSGLLKLIYPDKNVSSEDIKFVVDIAVDLRKSVTDQLKKICREEFSDIDFTFDIRR